MQFMPLARSALCGLVMPFLFGLLFLSLTIFELPFEFLKTMIRDAYSGMDPFH